MNAEHLLDISTSIDTNSVDIWRTCADFMAHLYWHKPRQTILKSKIERLPDDHLLKPECLFWLSRLFSDMGSYAEQKSFLLRALALCKQEGDDYRVTHGLKDLANANRMLGFLEEGIQQVREALEITERVGCTRDRVLCLNDLAWLFLDNKQLDAAQDAASRAINLSEKELENYHSHHLLGLTYSSKGEKERAIYHFEVALGIASSLALQYPVFSIHHTMALLSYDEDMLDDAQAHITQAKLHAFDGAHELGRAMNTQARIWHRQSRFGDAISEAARAIQIFEKLGAVKDSGLSRALLREIERSAKSQARPRGSDSSGKLSKIMSRLTPADFSFLACDAPSDALANTSQGTDHGSG